MRQVGATWDTVKRLVSARENLEPRAVRDSTPLIERAEQASLLAVDSRR